MRLKVLSIFLVFQLLAFGVWQGVSHIWPKFNDQMVAQTENVLRPSASFHLSAENGANKTVPVAPQIRQTIARVIERLPRGHTETLRTITLKEDPEAPRGLGGSYTIRLKSAGVPAEELIGVLLHEIGHVADLGYLRSPWGRTRSEFRDGDTPIYEGDPSLNFYRVSWRNDKATRPRAGNFDFVSGYAMTDPFEDFAESYAYYVLHGREFRFLAGTNPALYQKYTFLKKTVFRGQEFDTGKVGTMSIFRRVWDVTLLPYDFEQFLGISI